MLACLAISLSNCKKAEIERETQSAEDAFLAETVCNQVIALALAEAHSEPLVNNKNEGLGLDCVTETLSGDTATFPSGTVTLSLNFNGQVCGSIDNKVRSGAIDLVFTNNYWSNRNASFMATSASYTENGVTLTGDFVFRHVGTDTFSVVLENGTLSGSGFSFSYEFTKEVYWTLGSFSDTLATDDEFKMSGSMNGTNRNGRLFSGSIVSPVNWKTTCGNLQNGEIVITPKALSSRVITPAVNCSSQATLKVNGVDSSLTLQ